MTIRSGERYVVESLDQFMSRLDVSWQEIANALPPETQGLLVSEVNSIREEDGEPLVEDVSEMLDEEVAEEIHAGAIGTADIILHTLEARSREYAHVRDISVHQIIELYPTHPDEE